VRGTKRTLWEAWIDRYVDVDDPTPLFATESSGGGSTGEGPTGGGPTGDGRRVELTHYGRRRRRPVLRRSDAMDARLRDAVETVVDDHDARGGEYDGLVSLIYGTENGAVIPYYSGRPGPSDGLTTA
jgi:hypothetical protein